MHLQVSSTFSDAHVFFLANQSLFKVTVSPQRTPMPTSMIALEVMDAALVVIAACCASFPVRSRRRASLYSRNCLPDGSRQPQPRVPRRQRCPGTHTHLVAWQPRVGVGQGNRNKPALGTIGTRTLTSPSDSSCDSG